MKDKDRKKVKALAQKVGLVLNFRTPPSKKFGYENGVVFCKGMPIENILHEIAHYIICPPSRKKEPDFGLGRGPDSGDIAPCLVTREVNTVEEEMVSLLGIAYEVWLGRDPIPTLKSHEWISHMDTPTEYTNDFWAIISKLTKKRLLKNHIPTILP